MKSIYKILFAILIAGFLFVAVPTHNVWAGQCTATVNNFDANPKTLAFNQPINLTASIRVTGFESDGSCKDRDGNKYTSLRVQFRGDGFIIDGGTVAIRSSDPGPYQVTKSFKPSDYNKRAGERFSMVALISTGGSVAYSLTQSSPVPIILTAGSYGQWACVADDGKYACSPGNLRDCSDVISISPSSVITRICQGKPCVQIDNQLCGSPAPASTHKECRDRSCVVVSGPGPGNCPNNCVATPTVSPGGTGSQSFEIPNPIGVDNFQDLVNIIGRWIFNLAIPIAVIIIIYAGVLMLTSGGEPKRFQQGTQALKYAVIGLAVVLIGKGFVSLIKSILSLRNP